jgi:hypothetical protein
MVGISVARLTKEVVGSMGIATFPCPVLRARGVCQYKGSVAS